MSSVLRKQRVPWPPGVPRGCSAHGSQGLLGTSLVYPAQSSRAVAFLGVGQLLSAVHQGFCKGSSILYAFLMGKRTGNTQNPEVQVE